jgi:hypothetical protein
LLLIFTHLSHDDSLWGEFPALAGFVAVADRRFVHRRTSEPILQQHNPGADKHSLKLGTRAQKFVYSSSVQKAMDTLNAWRLYHVRSKITISPATANGKHIAGNTTASVSRSLGLSSATICSRRILLLGNPL